MPVLATAAVTARMGGVRRRLALVLAATVVTAGTVAVVHSMRPSQPVGCIADVGTARYPLDLEQAANAATIAAVGRRLGMPDHAVTVALAAALQESKLHNIAYGDRDSLGLFQQRPSQGWGTPSEVLRPDYAAAAFYRGLARVPGWQTLAVADAAQAVQHSAGGYAYAAWAAEARDLARVLTGEVPHGLVCHYAAADGAAASPTGRLAAELGVADVDRPLAGHQGWLVASWLVAHAPAYGIVEVTYAGLQWRNSVQGWTPAARDLPVVSYSTAGRDD